ncbi:hypothetical protein FWK35_00009084 [Aphis craccivora]|uniref:Uncharacterized protein n=1 Tax=Aphis craccivora TaxID=307492 RepID=A0A6G0ZGS8_APHCR|nr:hypothetical protein FWK35_00009084 [Aphis craccivora]
MNFYGTYNFSESALIRKPRAQEQAANVNEILEHSKKLRDSFEQYFSETQEMFIIQYQSVLKDISCIVLSEKLKTFSLPLAATYLCGSVFLTDTTIKMK